MTTLQLQGVNEDADAGTEDCVEAGGVYVGQPVIPTQAGEALNVVSASANDAAAGTGARTIRIEGLDAAGAWVEETVTLNGTTPVVTVSTWLRVIRAFVVTAGSGGVSAGAITVKHNVTTANIFSVIKAGRGMSMNAVFTVPAGKIGRVLSWGAQVYKISATAAAEAVCELVARPTGTNQAWRVLRQITASAVPTAKLMDTILTPGLRLSSLTDVKVRIVSTTADTFVCADLNVSWS